MFHNYYGKNTNTIANDSSLFEIASITKVFVGTLTAKAVQEKKIDLNQDIRDFLKGGYPNLEYQGTPITIQNLLTRTLGFKTKTPKNLARIQEQISNGLYDQKPLDYNMNDFLEELKTVELDKKPGTYYNYNSIATELTAYVLEQVYQDSFNNLLNRFLNELKMSNSYLQNSKKGFSKHIVEGFDRNGQVARKDRSVLLGAGGGMLSTLPDLAKFMRFQLESKNPIIKESTRLLFENDEDDKLAYFWEVDTAEEEGSYYLKTGTSNGTQSVILICPDTNYGMIILGNSTTEKGFNDWGNLYNLVEVDLIKYPKINLMVQIKNDIAQGKTIDLVSYKTLANNKDNYFVNPNEINQLGYQYLNQNETQKSISLFNLFVSLFPENANAYDSLGEAYFIHKDYKNALKNYKKSLVLHPKNTNAEQFINKINALIK